MDPGTLALAAMVAGGGLKTVGTLMEGQASSASANAQAQQLDAAAEVTRQQTNVREELLRRENERKLGEQRAVAAQSGFNPNSGSLAQIQGESAANAELDALTTRYQGQLQETGLRNDATMTRYKGRLAKRQSYMNAAGTLLMTAGAAYGMGASVPNPHAVTGIPYGMPHVG